MLAALGSPNIERLDVTVNNKDCIIKEVRFQGIHSYIHTIGNCDMIYDKCLEDNCNVQGVPLNEHNFGQDAIGIK